MYTVPRLAEVIATDWANEIAAKLGRPFEATGNLALSAHDFPIGTIRIQLMDESFVEFRYAFYIVSAQRRAIAVFTEHCGYHVFPWHEAKVYRDGILEYQQS